MYRYTKYYYDCVSPILVNLHPRGIFFIECSIVVPTQTWPEHKPLTVRRRSALSGLREVRNSARLVNMRYGSVTPRLTRSSIRTPM